MHNRASSGVRVTGRGAGTRAQTARVPCRISSVVAVRRMLRSELRDREVDPTVVHEAEIVMSELFANAVCHATALPDGKIRVDWAVSDGAVALSVTDGGGPTAPRPAPYSLWSANGRGLRIVHSLADEWGVRDEDGTQTVWVSLCGPALSHGQ